MKNLSMISKPQTGYTVKKVNANRVRAHASRTRQSSYELFMQERTDANVCYVGMLGGALVQPRA